MADPNRLTKLARDIALYVAAWATLSLFTASQLVLTYTATGGPAYWGATLRGSAMQWLPWLLLTPFVLAVARANPLRGPQRTRNALLQFVAPVVAAVGIVVLSYAIRSLSGSPITRPFRTEYLRNLHSIAIVYWLLVAGQHVATSLRQSREREAQVARLEAQLAGARFDVLQAQLHPHFLFNTMHGISSLIHEDPDAAEDMLTALSDLLRITLGRGTQREIPLRDELGFLERYLEIHKMRLGDRLTVVLDIRPDTADLLVPSFALQPLVENAIRHAIAPRRAGGRLQIRAERVGDVMRLTVADDGPGPSNASARSESGPGGMGLENTRARLAQLYGGSCKFTVTDADGGGTIVTLEIPARTTLTVTVPA